MSGQFSNREETVGSKFLCVFSGLLTSRSVSGSKMVGSVSKIHDRISNLFYVFSDRATLELAIRWRTPSTPLPTSSGAFPCTTPKRPYAVSTWLKRLTRGLADFMVRRPRRFAAAHPRRRDCRRGRRLACKDNKEYQRPF